MELIFAFIAPPGNIRRSIHILRKKAFEMGGGTSFGGSPDGACFGIYKKRLPREFPADPSEKKAPEPMGPPGWRRMAANFRESADAIFEALPDSFNFDTIAHIGGSTFLTTKPSTPPSRPPEIVSSFALASGLVPATLGFSFPLLTVFISDKELEMEVGGFELSFSHFDINLLRCWADASYENMRCVELASIPKKAHS